ncbi:MAG: universal stress protein [Pseudomonadota bacterium]
MAIRAKQKKKRTPRALDQERREFEALREARRNRFRILACIDGTDESYETVRMAARLGKGPDVDIIILYVRSIDQGLRSGGLQVRVARQNMLDWGLDLPGVKHLKRSIQVLNDEGVTDKGWTMTSSHTDTWNDPLGDNKIEYVHESGATVVLKLKTAPDTASGILDQYELGPYNLIILGEPSRWRGELSSFFDAGVDQKIMALSPCSVMIARPTARKSGFFICTDGTSAATDSVRQSAVLAAHAGEPITLFSVARTKDQRGLAEEHVANAAAALKAMKIKVETTKVAVGNPAEQIIRHGSSSRLIVVTNQHLTKLQRILVGSVTNAVVRGARTSVLNVR